MRARNAAAEIQVRAKICLLATPMFKRCDALIANAVYDVGDWAPILSWRMATLSQAHSLSALSPYQQRGLRIS